MSIAAVVVKPLFSGYIAHGLQLSNAMIQATLINVVGGAAAASQSNVEYAIWPASQLGSLGAPTYKANNGSTDGAGVFSQDVTGTFFPADEVILMFRQAAGGAGGADDNWTAMAATVV